MQRQYGFSLTDGGGCEGAVTLCCVHIIQPPGAQKTNRNEMDNLDTVHVIGHEVQ